MNSQPDNPSSGVSRVLVVEDHPLLRERLVQLINKEPDLFVCAETDNIADGLFLIRSMQPQLVVLDITLKGPNGLELVKEVTAEHLSVTILIVSMHEEMLYAERALRAGAKGFISKQEPSERIMSAIRQVLLGQTYLSPQMTSKIARTFSAGPANIAGIAGLTDREL